MQRQRFIDLEWVVYLRRAVRDVRQDRDNAYHIEAFYRYRLNDNISVTPGFWVILNPENDSRNDTQYVGVIRTTFDF